MLILVLGEDKLDIDRAVQHLTEMENKEVLNFKDLMASMKTSNELPDIYNSTILLDYLDILATQTSTTGSKLMTYMINQSRSRENTWIAKALDYRSIRDAPNIDKRLHRMHEVMATVSKTKILLHDRRTDTRTLIEYKKEVRNNGGKS